MSSNDKLMSRREAMKRATIGAGAVVAGSLMPSVVDAAPWHHQKINMDRLSGNPGNLIPEGASTLQDLSNRLAKIPRKRSFKTVPMILTNPDQWDSEALNEVIHYAGGPKQIWDNTDLTSPWLNLMRNSMNAQIWSFNHPDFLAVSATHGSAHLALYDDYIWNKYLATGTHGKWKANKWLAQPPQSDQSVSDFENPDGVFSPHDNSIIVLQRRGAIFLACHNEVWELTMGLHTRGVNPDALTHEEMAAEFTNHLVPGVILTPGIVGTMPELQLAGFQYAK